jgi:hypothetical protein
MTALPASSSELRCDGVVRHFLLTLGSLLLASSLALVPNEASARKNAHGPQGTGNYKGKKDRHEKPGPGNEKKKQSPNWIPLKKKSSSK